MPELATEAAAPSAGTPLLQLFGSIHRYWPVYGPLVAAWVSVNTSGPKEPSAVTVTLSRPM